MSWFAFRLPDIRFEDRVPNDFEEMIHTSEEVGRNLANIFISGDVRSAREWAHRYRGLVQQLTDGNSSLANSYLGIMFSAAKANICNGHPIDPGIYGMANAWFAMGQNRLTQALIQLPEEGRQILTSFNVRTGNPRGSWQAILRGVISSARVVDSLCRINHERVYFPFPKVDLKDNIDLFWRGRRTRYWTSIQIKTNCETIAWSLEEESLDSLPSKFHEEARKTVEGTTRIREQYSVKMRVVMIAVSKHVYPDHTVHNCADVDREIRKFFGA